MFDSARRLRENTKSRSGSNRDLYLIEKRSNPTLDRDGHGLPMDIVSGNAQGKGPGDLDIH
jgi:hypothetical protein